MFGFIRRQAAAKPVSAHPAVTDEPGKPILAFVIHQSSASTLPAILRKLGSARINGLAAEEMSQDDSVVTFKLGDDEAAVSHNAARYPSKELIRHAGQSWVF